MPEPEWHALAINHCVSFVTGPFGVGGVASRDILSGESLLTLPYAHVLSAPLCARSFWGAALLSVEAADLPPLSRRLLMYVVLMGARANAGCEDGLGDICLSCGRRPPLLAYVRSLPRAEDLNDPLWWPHELRKKLLGGTNLLAAVNDREARLRAAYDTVLVPRFMRARVPFCSGIDSDDVTSAFSWEAFLWAHSMVASRAFPPDLVPATHYSGAAQPCNVPGDMSRCSNNNDGDIRGCSVAADDDESTSVGPVGVLLPVLDGLNHGAQTPIEWVRDERGITFALPRNQPGGSGGNEAAPVVAISRGAPVLNNYGAKGDEELLGSYGFVLGRSLSSPNPFDTVAVRMSFSPHADAEAHSKTPAAPNSLLAALHLPQRHFLRRPMRAKSATVAIPDLDVCADGTVPAELMAALRIACLTKSQSAALINWIQTQEATQVVTAPVRRPSDATNNSSSFSDVCAPDYRSMNAETARRVAMSAPRCSKRDCCVGDNNNVESATDGILFGGFGLINEEAALIILQTQLRGKLDALRRAQPWVSQLHCEAMPSVDPDANITHELRNACDNVNAEVRSEGVILVDSLTSSEPKASRCSACGILASSSAAIPQHPDCFARSTSDDAAATQRVIVRMQRAETWTWMARVYVRSQASILEHALANVDRALQALHEVVWSESTYYLRRFPSTFASESTPMMPPHAADIPGASSRLFFAARADSEAGANLSALPYDNSQGIGDLSTLPYDNSQGIGVTACVTVAPDVCSMCPMTSPYKLCARLGPSSPLFSMPLRYTLCKLTVRHWSPVIADALDALGGDLSVATPIAAHIACDKNCAAASAYDSTGSVDAQSNIDAQRIQVALLLAYLRWRIVDKGTAGPADCAVTICAPIAAFITWAARMFSEEAVAMTIASLTPDGRAVPTRAATVASVIAHSDLGCANESKRPRGQHDTEGNEMYTSDATAATVYITKLQACWEEASLMFTEDILPALRVHARHLVRRGKSSPGRSLLTPPSITAGRFAWAVRVIDAMAVVVSTESMCATYPSRGLPRSAYHQVPRELLVLPPLFPRLPLVSFASHYAGMHDATFSKSDTTDCSLAQFADGVDLDGENAAIASLKRMLSAVTNPPGARWKLSTVLDEGVDPVTVAAPVRDPVLSCKLELVGARAVQHAACVSVLSSSPPQRQLTIAACGPSGSDIDVEEARNSMLLFV